MAAQKSESVVALLDSYLGHFSREGTNLHLSHEGFQQDIPDRGRGVGIAQEPPGRQEALGMESLGFPAEM